VFVIGSKRLEFCDRNKEKTEVCNVRLLNSLEAMRVKFVNVIPVCGHEKLNSLSFWETKLQLNSISSLSNPSKSKSKATKMSFG